MASVIDWGLSTKAGRYNRCPSPLSGYYADINTDLPPVTTRVHLCHACYDELRRAQQAIETWLSNGACCFTKIAGLVPVHRDEVEADAEFQAGVNSSMTLDDYLDLPYTVCVTPDPTGGYVASVVELPGCITQAATWEDIGQRIHDAMAAWISARLERGQTVPLPGRDTKDS